MSSSTEFKKSMGLSEMDIAEIKSILAQAPEVEAAIIFGSRAKGNYKPGSDVDIAVKGENVTFRTVSDISDKLNEETNMPYHFDIVNYGNISNRDLINHIDRVGSNIYQKEA